MIGLGVLVTVYYWAVFVPNGWDRWSGLDRAYYLRHLPVLGAVGLLGGVLLFRKWREKKGEK